MRDFPGTPVGEKLSSDLNAIVERALQELPEAATAALAAATPAIGESIRTVFAASDFVARACARDSQLLPQLIASGELQRTLRPADYAARAPPPGAAASESQLQGELRRWRQRELGRIAWRDLAGWADLAETLTELTAFADQAIVSALAWARQALVARYGEPRAASGTVQPLLVIAMGKLGGGELNFSSDVDLVLLFPEHGETEGPLCISNEEFFTRLGQALVRLLQT